MIEGLVDLLKRFRPNIFLGMLFVTILGGMISYMGYLMDNEGVISAAGVGTIIGIINLCNKILESDDDS